MGVIGRIFNFIMGLIGLVVLGFFVFLFFASEWQAHKERQNAEEREQLVSSAVQAARERGLGDLNQLRRDYLARCPIGELTVLEGDASQICAAMAEALIAQSQRREMTLSDHAELGYQLCALEARQENEDPEGYCSRQDVIDDALSDAVALGLCAFDRAWVIDPGSEDSVSKRGPAVYAYHELRVDCETRVFIDWYYEGFFDGVPEDEEWPPFLDELYEALESEDHGAVIALLETHEFGKDEQTDRRILNLFLEDRFAPLLPEVLDRNGGKVNFDNLYYDQPLSLAIEEESPKTALVLLDAGADPVRPYEYGQTPVVNAAGNGMLDVVKELVARGADVNGVVGSESLDFAEALRWASWQGHEETALWLLQNGAAIAPENPSQYPMWSAGTLLEYAVVGGDLAVVQALVQKGAKSEDSLRLIEGAVSGGDPDVLLFIFDQGYRLPEVKYHDRIYDAVVEVIKEEGKGRIEHGVRMFETLLERGLDMSGLEESGWNYGHQAIIHYAPPTVRLDSNDDRSTLVRAQRLRFVKRVIDEVLDAGIDIDHRYETETMLMKAADGAQAELVRYLLDHGADATLKNGEGLSALDIAVREGRRLTAFWDEDEALKNRFSEVIETLGGSRQMLNPPEDPGPDS